MNKKCSVFGCDNKAIGTHNHPPIKYCCHQHGCNIDLMGCGVGEEIGESALVNACKGLLNFIRKQYPDDFKPGGKGFTCSHHIAVEKALAECQNQEVVSDVGLDMIINLMTNEFWKASAERGKFNSTHEGYAVIKEELEELWGGVKTYGNKVACREAIQVGAMVMRFLYDFGDLKVTKDDK